MTKNTGREELPPGIGTKPERPKGKKGQEAFKKFIYATYLSPEEEQLYEVLEDADLGHEAKLIRIRIARLLGEERMLKLENTLEEFLEDEPQLTAKEVAERCMVMEEFHEGESDKDGAMWKSVKRRKQIDYLLMSYIARLAALEKTRQELAQGGVNAAEDKGRAVIDAIAQMKAKRGVVDDSITE